MGKNMGISDNRRRSIILKHVPKCKSTTCEIFNCNAVKDVLKHMVDCKDGECKSLRSDPSPSQILAHCEHCPQCFLSFKRANPIEESEESKQAKLWKEQSATRQHEWDLYYQQMHKLRHAKECSEMQCGLIDCSTTKTLLKHIIEVRRNFMTTYVCNDGEECQFADCALSRKILAQRDHIQRGKGRRRQELIMFHVEKCKSTLCDVDYCNAMKDVLKRMADGKDGECESLHPPCDILTHFWHCSNNCRLSCVLDVVKQDTRIRRGQVLPRRPQPTYPRQCATPADNLKSFRQQYLLMMYDKECSEMQCLIDCSPTKKLLKHVYDCNDGEECQFAHCSSSRNIFAYWDQCRRADCRLRHTITLKHVQKCKSTPCDVDYCNAMKDVLKHMADGKDGECTSLRSDSSPYEILTHWDHCSSKNCRLCCVLGDHIKQDTRFRRQQLLILMHAKECSEMQCGMVDCSVTKKILKHVYDCNVGEKCQLFSCAEARKILPHLDQCKDCPLCPSKDTRVMRDQFFLMVHAKECSEIQCGVIDCSPTKKLLKHVYDCNVGEECQFAYCALSRKIFAHLDQCRSLDCYLRRTRIQNHVQKCKLTSCDSPNLHFECNAMKDVLKRMADCKGGDCQSLRCDSSSSQILAHCKHCPQCFLSFKQANHYKYILLPQQEQDTRVVRQLEPHRPQSTYPGQCATPADNLKSIQQQLLLVVHAKGCSKMQCGRIDCSLMKKVLKHAYDCNVGAQCQFAHCSSSRKILAHLGRCGNKNCRICCVYHINQRVRINQFLLLKHAKVCSEMQCCLTDCSPAKILLKHVDDCNVGEKCQFPYCPSARKILAHLDQCISKDCPLCPSKVHVL